jgi:hypothetical protein
LSLVLIIAGWGMAVIAASTLIWHRRREREARFAWARENNLELYRGRPRDLIFQLRELALLQIGHSRRMEAAFVLPGGGYAFCYLCQTGFEQDRFMHAWIVAAVECAPETTRAIITAQDWLRAGVHDPSRRTLPLNGTEAKSATVAIVEDADEWRRRLNGPLGRWLRTQPPERSWEFMPGWLAGYEPGSAEGRALLALTAAAKELSDLLADCEPHEAPSSADSKVHGSARR